MCIDNSGLGINERGNENVKGKYEEADEQNENNKGFWECQIEGELSCPYSSAFFIVLLITTKCVIYRLST